MSYSGYMLTVQFSWYGLKIINSNAFLFLMHNYYEGMDRERNWHDAMDLEDATFFIINCPQ